VQGETLGQGREPVRDRWADSDQVFQGPGVGAARVANVVAQAALAGPECRAWVGWVFDVVVDKIRVACVDGGGNGGKPGRTQFLVHTLNELFNEGKLPSIPIFVDSPLSTNVTEVFRTHPLTWKRIRQLHRLEEEISSK
jgi:hypothetical protein